jgi:hypothetical protein
MRIACVGSAHRVDPPAALVWFLFLYQKTHNMQNWLRTLLAGWGAYKWGGGCLGTIILFVLFYWLLGHC